MKSLSSLLLVCFTLSVFHISLSASEVIEDTHTNVIMREHPKTGRPYVSIVSSDVPVPEDPFAKFRQISKRPDYRMLDPKVKPGEIPYEGPYSDSKKIYIFAATLAALGTAGGAIGLAAIPVSTGAAASGGGAYLGAGSAVAVGSAAGVVVKTNVSSKQDDFVQTSKSELLEEKEKKEIASST